MIYLVGDLHGDRERISKLILSDTISDKDYLIVLGDFGFIYYNNEDEEKFLDYLEENCKFTLLFVDGNHECFPKIYSYPVEVWNNGKVHRIRDNILHLQRGEVFEIEGNKIFTMGGAYSIDKARRTEGISYWYEEKPNNEEYVNATNNLKRYGMNVDYILTHTMPKNLIYQIGCYPNYHDDELTGFFDWMYNEASFKKWYCGHWHIDVRVNDKFSVLYKEIIKLGE